MPSMNSYFVFCILVFSAYCFFRFKLWTPTRKLAAKLHFHFFLSLFILVLNSIYHPLIFILLLGYGPENFLFRPLPHGANGIETKDTFYFVSMAMYGAYLLILYCYFRYFLKINITVKKFIEVKGPRLGLVPALLVFIAILTLNEWNGFGFIGAPLTLFALLSVILLSVKSYSEINVGLAPNLLVFLGIFAFAAANFFESIGGPLILFLLLFIIIHLKLGRKTH